MNEPWPGENWTPCVTGCPDLEQQLLAPFYARMSEAVRTVDRRHPLYVEPFVLFNFGLAATALPGAGPAHALSTHVYALDADANLAVMQRSVEAATRDGAPVLTTEWGATNDPAVVTALADQFDSQLLPWLFWSYYENVILEPHLPATPDNLRGPVLDALDAGVSDCGERHADAPRLRRREPYARLRVRDDAAGRAPRPVLGADDDHRAGCPLSDRLCRGRDRCQGDFEAVRAFVDPREPASGNGGLRARHTGSVPVAAPGRRAASASATMHSAAITGTSTRRASCSDRRAHRSRPARAGSPRARPTPPRRCRRRVGDPVRDRRRRRALDMTSPRRRR